jgi:hypothetical protein
MKKSQLIIALLLLASGIVASNYSSAETITKCDATNTSVCVLRVNGYVLAGTGNVVETINNP